MYQKYQQNTLPSNLYSRRTHPKRGMHFILNAPTKLNNSTNRASIKLPSTSTNNLLSNINKTGHVV